MQTKHQISSAVAWKRETKRDRGAFTVATYVAVTLSLIVAAILAPVKTTEQVLDRPLVLPMTELTIADLAVVLRIATT